MTSYSPLISKVYQSRNILLEILKDRGFNVEDYEGFSMNEIHVMYNNKQLDLLLEKDNGEKLYVKYHLATRLSPSHLYDYVDDLFDVEEILNDKDELIVVSKDKVNVTMKTLLEEMYIKDGKYINIYNLNDYLSNILKHELQPSFEILPEEKKLELMKKYNITNDKEFKEISRFDPVAKTIGLRPSQVCKILRSSPTAIIGVDYRMCY